MEKEPIQTIPSKIIDNQMSPRFGHTFTLVSKDKENAKAVWFGGATGTDGRFSINADTYIYMIYQQKWVKWTPKGTVPTPRAAHAACSISENELVIYGGATGSGGLASDELFLLNLKKGEQEAEWTKVQISKPATPGKRYGHSLVFYKPNLIWYGGNVENECKSDVWIFNIDNKKLEWIRLDINTPIPPARVYHSAAICTYGSANGMMVVFGGRQKNGKSTNDMWGWRKHRTGVWDWTEAPYKGQPADRIQHTSVFCGNYFINIGGRSEATGDNLPIEIYDTDCSEWSTLTVWKRYRHSSFLFENFLYIHGGWEDDKHSNPAKALWEFNWFDLFSKQPEIVNKVKLFFSKSKTDTKDKFEEKADSNENGKKLMLSENAIVCSGVGTSKNDFGDIVQMYSLKKLNNQKNEKQEIYNLINNQAWKYEIEDKFLMALLRPKEWIEKQFEEDETFDFEQELIIQWIDKCWIVVKEQPMVLKVEAPVKVFGDIHGQYQDLMRFFDWYSMPSTGKGGDIDGLDYIFLGDYVDRGTHSWETMCLLMALKIKYPNQIHLLRGNHEDRWINMAFGFQTELNMRLADESKNNQVFNKFNDFFDYLPLAAIINDTVLCWHGGIGSNITSISDIEKIARPLEVVHEVTSIAEQWVVDILWSDPTDSDQETGIQPNSTRDPTGVGNIVKFGPDRVENFLKNNNLTLILRAHECVMDGFERFAGGKWMTVFSATDYCGKHKNAGAIWFLTKHFLIKPYLIYPTACPNKNWENNEEELKWRPPTPPRARQNSPNEIGKKGSFN